MVHFTFYPKRLTNEDNGSNQINKRAMLFYYILSKNKTNGQNRKKNKES